MSAWLLGGEDVAISAAVAGMGGIGKSTLAQKLGQGLAPRFPGGVLWLDIGPHATADDLAARLAKQLGIDLKDEPTLGITAPYAQTCD